MGDEKKSYLEANPRQPIIMKHEFGIWNPLRDRKCKHCGLSESNATTDCPGKGFGSAERDWLLAFEEDICDYKNGEWVDWACRTVGNDIMILRQRQAAYVLKKGAEFTSKSTRASHLKAKMEMEDELLTHSKYRGLNPRPFD